MSDRQDSVELRVVSDSGTIERALPLRRTTRALLGAVAASVLVALVGGAAVVPSVLTTMRARSQYELRLARRAQLGDRLRALVESLDRLDRQSQRLARRLARYETIYGLTPPPAPEVRVPEPAADEPASIFVATMARGRRLVAELEARLPWIDQRTAAVAAWESSHGSVVSSLPVGRPLEGEVSVPTSGFGPRRIPGGGTLEFHPGLDIAALAGAKIVATGEGRVVWAGEAPANAGPSWWRLGRLVAILHGDDFLTVYGHCERVLVGRGARVRAGQEIARVGASGWTASPQLHYEVRKRTAEGWPALDPRIFLLALELPESSQPTDALGGGAAAAPLPRAFRP